jgi:adenylate cyclase
VSVAPTNEIGRRPVSTVHFENDAFTIGVTHVMTPDDQPIADICSHRSSFLDRAPNPVADPSQHLTVWSNASEPSERSVPNVYILPDQRLVACGSGEAILPAALRADIPFAHACGGNAFCSTCRVVVLSGQSACSPRTPKERVIADRLSFGTEFRLACQTKVAGDVTIRRLVLDQHDLELADLRPRRVRSVPSGRRRLGVGWRRARSRTGPQPIGQELAVAVLFADIRGFTAFAEALLPYDVIHVLQRQLRDVTAIVERHAGVVTSYMGDGVMALFGPNHPEPSSLRGVKAGLEMLAETDRRRHELEALYGRSFDVNVGLHHGEAIVGTVWGGAASLTAIGDNVNFASRIEQANKQLGTRFLISDAALAELGDTVVVGRSFRCSLPGKAGEHTLIEVLDTADRGRS